MYLGFPAGESRSECVFSTTTGIVTKKRARLSNIMVEALTIIREFLSLPDYSFDVLMEALTEFLTENKMVTTEEK